MVDQALPTYNSDTSEYSKLLPNNAGSKSSPFQTSSDLDNSENCVERETSLLPLTYCRCCQNPMTNEIPSACTFPCGHNFHTVCLQKRVPFPQHCPKCLESMPGLEDDLEGIPGLGFDVKELPLKAPKCLKKCSTCKKRIHTMTPPTCQSTCGHLFHFTCMDKLVEMKAACPVCRVPVGIVGNGLKLEESLRSPMFKPEFEPILESLDE
uniref:RING-type domain-containing protein n=1 Tax=Panagrellus redivivus TaxID=6233 RepID=A0A7E4W904_PANRE